MGNFLTIYRFALLRLFFHEYKLVSVFLYERQKSARIFSTLRRSDAFLFPVVYAKLFLNHIILVKYTDVFCGGLFCRSEIRRGQSH